MQETLDHYLHAFAHLNNMPVRVVKPDRPLSPSVLLERGQHLYVWKLLEVRYKGINIVVLETKLANIIAIAKLYRLVVKKFYPLAFRQKVEALKDDIYFQIQEYCPRQDIFIEAARRVYILYDQ